MDCKEPPVISSGFSLSMRLRMTPTHYLYPAASEGKERKKTFGGNKFFFRISPLWREKRFSLRLFGRISYSFVLVILEFRNVDVKRRRAIGRFHTGPSLHSKHAVEMEKKKKT